MGSCSETACGAAVSLFESDPAVRSVSPAMVPATSGVLYSGRTDPGCGITDPVFVLERTSHYNGDPGRFSGMKHQLLLLEINTLLSYLVRAWLYKDLHEWLMNNHFSYQNGDRHDSWRKNTVSYCRKTTSCNLTESQWICPILSNGLH